MKNKDLTPHNAHGQRHGYWEMYHNNGNLFYRGIYINGKTNGYWEFYHIVGGIWAKGNYINDKTVGLWEWYNEDNKLDEQIFYA